MMQKAEVLPSSARLFVDSDKDHSTPLLRETRSPILKEFSP